MQGIMARFTCQPLIEDSRDTIRPMDICQYKGCNRSADTVYSDVQGDWTLCSPHGRRMRHLDDMESGLRIGVLGGIFAGFLTNTP